MHPYSSDNQRIGHAYLGAAIAAVLLAYGLGALLAALEVSPPWWLDTPAVIGFYGIVWKFYDTVLWRIPLGGGRNLAGSLNLRGGWTGEIHSDYDGGTIVPATLHIDQTATRIRIALTTEKSRSGSDMALILSSDSFRELHYNYFNRPDPLAEVTMNAHGGSAHLRLSGNRLEGGYRNDGRRSTSGRMRFTRD